MEVNGALSLTQLTGVDWGHAPEGSGTLVRERHEARHTALDALSTESLKRLLSIDFSDDCIYLIPHCLEKIDDRLSCDEKLGEEKLFRFSGLLLAVLSNETFGWLKYPHLVNKSRELVNAASYALDILSNDAEMTDDSLEFYKALLPITQMKSSLYRTLSLFEQRISKIEPNRAADA